MAVAVVYRCKLLISKLGRSSLQIWCYSSGGHPQRLPRFEQLLYALCIRSAYTINFERWWWLSCNTEAYICKMIHEIFYKPEAGWHFFAWHVKRLQKSSWRTADSLFHSVLSAAESNLLHAFCLLFVSAPRDQGKMPDAFGQLFQILNTSTTLLVVVALIASFDMFDFLSLVASDAPKNHFSGI